MFPDLVTRAHPVCTFEFPKHGRIKLNSQRVWKMLRISQRFLYPKQFGKEKKITAIKYL